MVIMWQSWINLIDGIWLILCGFITALRTPASMIVGGAVAIVLGYWSAVSSKDWKRAVNGTIGIWLFLSGLWFNLDVRWNFLIFGVALLLISLWNISNHPTPTNITAKV